MFEFYILYVKPEKSISGEKTLKAGNICKWNKV